MLSEATQDYLKAIWKLGQDGPASTSAIADELAVSPASATGMLKRLAALGLVEHERYHGATLTPRASASRSRSSATIGCSSST